MPIMADQNTEIIFIWLNFATRGFIKNPQKGQKVQPTSQL